MNSDSSVLKIIKDILGAETILPEEITLVKVGKKEVILGTLTDPTLRQLLLAAQTVNQEKNTLIDDYLEMNPNMEQPADPKVFRRIKQLEKKYERLMDLFWSEIRNTYPEATGLGLRKDWVIVEIPQKTKRWKILGKII